ncbi:histidine kinase osmosensor, partial [Basidiobolus ranarum]
MTTDFLRYVENVLTSISQGNFQNNSIINPATTDMERKVELALQQVILRQNLLEGQVENYQQRLEKELQTDRLVTNEETHGFIAVEKSQIVKNDGDIHANLTQAEQLAFLPHTQYSNLLSNSEDDSLFTSRTSSFTGENMDYISNCIEECTSVADAITNGDLTQRVTCQKLSGSALKLKSAVNGMAERLETLTSEVLHVQHEMAEMGKLCIQGETENWNGSWKDIMININRVAATHSEQVRDIAEVCTSVAQGDLSKKITVDLKGETLLLKNTINTMVDQLNSFASEVTRVAHEVGTEGKLGVQADVPGVGGTWKLLTDNVNLMASNLTDQVRDIASVSKAVARGDLSKTVTVNVKGEMHELKTTINTMVDQLQTFATEVTRVSLEVGTEGKLGGQAVVKDVGGTWKDLTDNVNLMASNLTDQVRDIANVSKAVAKGDLSKKVTVDVKGEINELKMTINTMVDQLQTFASEVTRVAREVGTEGKLGGQAVVKDVGGTWKDLTDNVNLMASNLTDQVRDIANVSKA